MTTLAKGSDVSTQSLSDRMEFDHVIRVHADGSVTDLPSCDGPELFEEELSGNAWSFFTYGYTGQYGYRGPIMHNSEFIGGKLERDILATPGIYVSLVNYVVSEDQGESDIEGWAVAFIHEDDIPAGML